MGMLNLINHFYDASNTCCHTVHSIIVSQTLSDQNVVTIHSTALSQQGSQASSNQVLNIDQSINHHFSTSTSSHSKRTLVNSELLSAQFHLMDEKTVGFLANPMGRVIDWHQSKKIQTNSLVQWVVEAHNRIQASNLPNYQSARIIVPSDLNISNLKTVMANHPDAIFTQYLEFGFTLTVGREKLELNTDTVNHPSAQKFLEDVDIYLRKDVQHKAMVGPLQSKIISNLYIYPIMSRPKPNASRRIIVDLS